MKKIALLLVVLAVTATAFTAGRFTAPAPRFDAQALDPSNPMDAAFEEFIQAQRDTLALYKTHENFDDPLAAAEAYRGVLYTIVGSIKSGALMSHEYPRAMRGVDWTSKAGLDNPDNNYFFALLDDEGSYRLYGKRGNTTQLIFQLVIGVPGWVTQAPVPMSMCCMTRTSSSMKTVILRLLSALSGPMTRKTG